MDLVNNPAHYTQGKVEAIETIENVLTIDQFRGYLIGNAMKYIIRHEYKGGKLDIEKAIWYLKRYEDSFEDF